MYINGHTQYAHPIEYIKFCQYTIAYRYTRA